jgi:hypothetical protein|nr:MAG TPA: hypothetical protein [Caudoviricetes sp.]
MEMLTLIISLSIIMWYIIDRFKEMWEGTKYGKYITMAVSAVFAFAISFGFGVDIILALGLVQEGSVIGTVITALALMSGSSAVSEIIERVKGGQ